jgi:hypothetical protein
VRGKRKDIVPSGNLAYKEPEGNAAAQEDASSSEIAMRNLRDTLDDLRTMFLCAARRLVSTLRPSPLTDQQKRENSEFLKRVKADDANRPTYTAEELYDKFVQPLVDERPELGKMFSKKSFHL